MILAILGVIVVVILGLIGWCIFRFFKKKKPKGAEEKGKEDDENALVDNEEANAEEVSPFKIIFSVKIGQNWPQLGKIVDFVRWYWGHEDTIPYADYMEIQQDKFQSGKGSEEVSLENDISTL